jgi:hypothetical protein
VTISFAILPAVVPATTTLADKGAAWTRSSRASHSSERRPEQAFLAANGAAIARARKDNPGQWQTWWWICFAAQLAFIPSASVLTGFWRPRKAHAAQRERERLVERELARLRGHRTA